MSSKFRKQLKFAPQFFTIIGALSMAIAMLLSVVNLPVMANGGVINWQGNGSNNLPCVNGVAQWNFSGGQNITSAVLTVNGQNYGMSQTGGVWKAQVPGLSTVNEAFVTYNGELGNGNAVLTISHCTITDPPDPTNTPVSPTNTPVSPTNTPVSPTNTPVTPTNTPVTPTNTPVTPTNTPTNTPTFTPTNTAVPDDPTQTPGGPTATNTPTFTPTNTEVPPTATPTTTEVPKDPDPTETPVTTEVPNDPDPTATPELDETPDPTEPPVEDETPEPTLAPPVTNDPPTVLIPVTGIELGGNSPLSDVQNVMFNLGLSFLGVGLVLQSLRKRLNF